MNNEAINEAKKNLLLHNKKKCTRQIAIVHSQKEKGAQNVWIAYKRIGENLYLALVDGKFCTAIFNPFVGCYYVDDIYGIVE